MTNLALKGRPGGDCRCRPNHVVVQPEIDFLFVCLLGNLFSSGFNPSCVFALYSIEGS